MTHELTLPKFLSHFYIKLEEVGVNLDNFKVKILGCVRRKEFIVLCINKSDLTGILPWYLPTPERVSFLWNVIGFLNVCVYTCCVCLYFIYSSMYFLYHEVEDLSIVIINVIEYNDHL